MGDNIDGPERKTTKESRVYALEMAIYNLVEGDLSPEKMTIFLSKMRQKMAVS